MACFVCDEKPSTYTNVNGEAGDCSRCGPSVVLNWKNGQRVLEHMVAHILHDNLLDGSEECCGLCLRPAPMCQLYLRKPRGTSANVSVDYKKSSCVNLIHFNYATASTSSEASPCSNVPIACPLCPDGNPAVWTYSLYAHFRGKHRLQSHTHFPVKFSLSQSEKDGIRHIWNSRYKHPKPRKLKPKKKSTLSVSEAHRARLYIPSVPLSSSHMYVSKYFLIVLFFQELCDWR